MNPLHEEKSSCPPKVARNKLLLPNFTFSLAVVMSVPSQKEEGPYWLPWAILNLKAQHGLSRGDQELLCTSHRLVGSGQDPHSNPKSNLLKNPHGSKYFPCPIPFLLQCLSFLPAPSVSAQDVPQVQSGDLLQNAASRTDFPLGKGGGGSVGLLVFPLCASTWPGLV